jgi:hypothetical protein
MSAPLLSVVVPAHDEEHVLPRLLRGLHDPRLEVVVVANGCRDATAATARSAGPGIRVVEIPAASKPAALDAGDAATTVFPRAYVDADVEVDSATLLALAEVLGDRALVASPALRLELAGASRGVRACYRIWELSEFRTAGHIGSGIYAVSRGGRERWGRFPELIGDDRYVQGLFAPAERATLADHAFAVRPPRTLRALVARGARIAAGNAQLRDAGAADHTPGVAASFRGLLGRVAPHPALWPAFGLYCLVQLRTRALARRLLAGEGAPAWTRDETSRA